MEPGRRPLVLVVEDDPLAAEMIQDMLEGRGYAVAVAETGAAAKALVGQSPPDLVVLDLVLPDVDGLVLCAALREASNAAVIVCSATARKRDRVLALKLGADDFVAKPFDMEEMAARVDALLRRPRAAEEEGTASVLRVGDLVVDDARRRVTVGDQQVDLTPTEYRLLQVLAGRPEAVVGRDELARAVWGGREALGGRRIDAAMQRLRTKLPHPTTTSPRVVTVRGVGYGLTSEAEGA